VDTDGNICGGFTPAEWDSSNKDKADPSLKSFIFTLKNPHNVPARRFALKAERKDKAIYCNSEGGPNFCDMRVYGNYTNTVTKFFGSSYTNDTGLNGETFFTGSRDFQVKEIEVFKIMQ
jgi:hypothetical protein